MPITAPQVVEKQPLETRKLSIDFSALLESGETLTGSPTVTSEKLNGDATDLTVASIAINGALVTFLLSGGTAGVYYRIEATTTTSQSQTLEGDAIIRVTDK